MSKTLLLILNISLFTCTLNAQKVYFETGFATAYFKDYLNNKGKNTLDLSYSKATKPFLETGFRFQFPNERFSWNTAVSYSTYKINTGFYSGELSVPVAYELAYVALKSGISFSFISLPTFQMQLHTHLSFDLLTSGLSTYQNKVNNLYKERTLDRNLLRYHRGLSAIYTVSKKISVFVNYNVADSFKEKNNDSNKEEKYSLHTNAYSFGVHFSLQPLNFI
jgi:hypothetical protein